LRPAQAVEVVEFTFNRHEGAEELLSLFLENIRDVVRQRKKREEYLCHDETFGILDVLLSFLFQETISAVVVARHKGKHMVQENSTRCV
jgi:hypothetical protein